MSNPYNAPDARGNDSSQSCYGIWILAAIFALLALGLGFASLLLLSVAPAPVGPAARPVVAPQDLTAEAESPADVESTEQKQRDN